MSKERYEVKPVPAYNNIHGVWDHKNKTFAPKEDGRVMRFADTTRAALVCERMNRADKASTKAANEKAFEAAAPKPATKVSETVTTNGTGKKPGRSKPKTVEAPVPALVAKKSGRKPKATVPEPAKNEHQGRRKKAA